MPSAGTTRTIDDPGNDVLTGLMPRRGTVGRYCPRTASGNGESLGRDLHRCSVAKTLGASLDLADADTSASRPCGPAREFTP